VVAPDTVADGTLLTVITTVSATVFVQVFGLPSLTLINIYLNVPMELVETGRLTLLPDVVEIVCAAPLLILYVNV
jgi:hypothetical protein